MHMLIRCRFNFLQLDFDTSEKINDEIQNQLDEEKRAILYDDSAQLCIKFTVFINKTEVRLRNKVTANSLATFVLTTLNCLRMKYPADLPEKLNACKEVGEILRELTHEGCDVIVFHDIDILELIIQNYLGEDDEELNRYKMELENYLKRRICEHHLFQSDVVGTEVMSVSPNAKLYVFMDSTWTKDMSSIKLFKLKKRLATVLQCRHIRLTEIRVGSLCFCFTILEEDFAHSELQIKQVLSLINLGVKVLSQEIGGFEHSKHMGKACKYDYGSPPLMVFVCVLLQKFYLNLFSYSIDKNLMLPVLPSPSSSDWRG